MSHADSRSALETVQQTYAALGRNDIDALLNLSHPEITVFQSQLVPWGGLRHGKDGLLEFLQGVGSHLQSQVSPHEMFVAGDTVVQIGTTRGTAISTGRSFEAAEVHLWQIRDSLVIAFAAYVDTDALQQALTP